MLFDDASMINLARPGQVSRSVLCGEGYANVSQMGCLAFSRAVPPVAQAFIRHTSPRNLTSFFEKGGMAWETKQPVSIGAVMKTSPVTFTVLAAVSIASATM